MNTLNAAGFMVRMHQSVCLLVDPCLLGGCTLEQTPQQLQLQPGARFHEVSMIAGKSTGKFSYVMNGHKYDVVDFEKLGTSLVFEDARLFVCVSENGWADWDSCVAEAMKAGDLPFENGLGSIHSWVLAQRRSSQSQAGSSGPADPSTPVGDVTEGLAGAAILAPISPILLAGGLVGGATYAMTGDDRVRAQAVNDSRVGPDNSYAALLSKFSKPVMDASKGTYRVREFYATQDSFFTSSDHFYDIGTRNGKVLWVAYQSDMIRSKTYRYWSQRRTD